AAGLRPASEGGKSSGSLSADERGLFVWARGTGRPPRMGSSCPARSGPTHPAAHASAAATAVTTHPLAVRWLMAPPFAWTSVRLESLTYPNRLLDCPASSRSEISYSRHRSGRQGG